MALQVCELPVVDPSSPEAAETIAKACKEYGFFILTNHGIDPDLLPEVFRQTRAFFQLPQEVKSAHSAHNSRGYTPPFHEILDPANQSVAESKEGYYIRREVAEDGSDGDPLTGPNCWPSDDLVPGWRDTMLRYFDAMMALGLRVAALLAEGLRLERDFFAPHFTRSMSALRLLHYRAEVSDVFKGVLGAGAHSDYGLLTLLATDDVPGLQVQLNGEWFDVPPRPADFIVNLGDMLQRWTNDALRSTVHRVVNAAGRERYSIPFFFEPNFDTQVTCLPQFVSAVRPARYTPTTSGRHLLDKYAQTHTDASPEANPGS